MRLEDSSLLVHHDFNAYLIFSEIQEIAVEMFREQLEVLLNVLIQILGDVTLILCKIALGLIILDLLLAPGLQPVHNFRPSCRSHPQH